MASKVLLVLAMLVFLSDGHTPGAREVRNPDAEGGGHGSAAARMALSAKRTTGA